MGGKSGGGSSFAEKGTPLSSQQLSQQKMSSAQAVKARRQGIPEGGGDAGPGYEGVAVDKDTGLAYGAGLAAFLGTMAVTGEPITSATMAYQAYSAMEPEDKAKTEKAAKARGFSLSDIFGSLLDDGDEDGFGKDGPGGQGGGFDGGQGGMGGGFGGQDAGGTGATGVA